MTDTTRANERVVARQPNSNVIDGEAKSFGITFDTVDFLIARLSV